MSLRSLFFPSCCRVLSSLRVRHAGASQQVLKLPVVLLLLQQVCGPRLPGVQRGWCSSQCQSPCAMTRHALCTPCARPVHDSARRHATLKGRLLRPCPTKPPPPQCNGHTAPRRRPSVHPAASASAWRAAAPGAACPASPRSSRLAVPVGWGRGVRQGTVFRKLKDRVAVLAACISCSCLARADERMSRSTRLLRRCELHLLHSSGCTRTAWMRTPASRSAPSASGRQTAPCSPGARWPLYVGF